MDGPFSIDGIIIFTTIVLFNESFSVVRIGILDLGYRIKKLLS